MIYYKSATFNYDFYNFFLFYVFLFTNKKINKYLLFSSHYSFYFLVN